MRKIILGTILTSIILTLSIGDADARRRKHTRSDNHRVVRVVPPPKPVSVFDQQDWQPPVILPGFMSVVQAAMAGSYLWEAENIFPPVRVEWVHANELSPLDKQVLKQGQKPVISPFSGVVWATFGAVCAACVGLGLLALYVNKDLVRLT